MGSCFSTGEPVDFDSPVNFTHFEILRAIGKGAFGKVCIVKKKDSKEMYAMKYMNKLQIIEKRATDNVFREITILKSLEHPFIVNLWFAFQDEEDIFVVIDLMLGGDLSYHLEKEGRFVVQRVQLYVAESCLALDYLREKKIIHRDIKPANMLLDSKGHVHLTDFNVACYVKEGKIITSMTGTKPYMAPEVIKSSSSTGYSFAVDWWSLGVSAYEMLRGERPYSIHQHTSNTEIYNMLTQVRPPASVRWDEATCNILKVLLHPDPNKRLSTLEKVKTHQFFADLDWEKVLNAETTPVYVPSQNRIHCDPTHELEEMIVEPNPLHKKKARLSKKQKKDQEDSKIGNELNKMNARFNVYNRLKENVTIVESTHELEESENNFVAPSSSDDRLHLHLTNATAISLPRQESPYSTEDKHNIVSPVEVDVELHIAERQNSTASTEPLIVSRASSSLDNVIEHSNTNSKNTTEHTKNKDAKINPSVGNDEKDGAATTKGNEDAPLVNGNNEELPKKDIPLIDTRTDANNQLVN